MLVLTVCISGSRVARCGQSEAVGSPQVALFFFWRLEKNVEGEGDGLSLA